MEDLHMQETSKRGSRGWSMVGVSGVRLSC